MFCAEELNIDELNASQSPLGTVIGFIFSGNFTILPFSSRASSPSKYLIISRLPL